MSEIGEIFQGLKQRSQAKRAANRDSSAQMLADAGIEFEVRNGGAHLVLQSKWGPVEFWPGTGLWIPRGLKQRGRGIHGLLRFVKPHSGADQ